MLRTLGWVDYLIWILSLVISLVIGIYFAIIEYRKRKLKSGENETSEFLLGGRKMGAIPVSCSIMASFFSAITLLGTPNEIYTYGVIYWFIGIGYILTVSFSAFLFVPVFYNIGITSSYEYLGLRFSKINQIIAAVSFILQTSPYLGIVLYGPSLALTIVIDANIWIIVSSMAVLCTIYTTVGGIKAVVWTDVLQLVLMFGGMVGIVIKGSVDAGGFQNVVDTMWKHERMQLNFSFDPRTRHSIWGLIIGGGFLWSGIYAINQTMIQRAICIKSLNKAKLAFLLNLLGMNLLLLILCLCGFVIFHILYGCDPLIVKEIDKSDQLVPYYVSKYLLQYPGVGGIFVAGIFSGGLSTMSSGLNSLAAVTLRDIVMVKYKNINDRTSSIISKVLVIFYGVITMVFAYVSSLTSKILEAALGLFGMLSGPSLGAFTLGMFFPFTNHKGAISGHIISQIIILWIGFGSYAHNIKHPKLVISNFNCTGLGNITNPTGHMITAMGKPLEGVQNLYAISYLWYTLIGWFIVLIVGIPVSLLTKSETDVKVQFQFISPPFRRLWKKYLHEDSKISFSNDGKSPENIAKEDTGNEINNYLSSKL